MNTLTIRLENESGYVTFESLKHALGQVVGMWLYARGDEAAELKAIIARVGKVAERLLGRFERDRIADDVCLAAEQVLGEGGRVEDVFYACWPTVPRYAWSSALVQRGRKFVAASNNDWLREIRSGRTRKFSDTPVAEVKAMAEAGDADAKATIAILAEKGRAAVAQLDRHFARFGVEETYRRAGIAYPPPADGVAA